MQTALAHNHDHIELVTNKKPTLRLLSKIDPARTLTIKNRFMREVDKRFNWLVSIIKEGVGKQDLLFLGKDAEKLSVKNIMSKSDALAALASKNFKFNTSAEKVTKFMDWLGDMEKSSVLEVVRRPISIRAETSVQAWSNTYIQSAYQKGIYRARQEMRKAGVDITQIKPDPNDEVRVLFNKPFHADRVGLLYTRTFNELKGITSAMDKQISSVLAQGIAEGKNPLTIANELTDRVKKIGRTRARSLARTEVQRAHHQANINEYEAAQIQGVVVKAEWLTGANPCPICASLEGSVFTLEKIRGMIPAHPNCVCIALPYQPGIDKVKPSIKGVHGWLPDCSDVAHDVIPITLARIFVTLAAKACLKPVDKSKVKKAIKSHIPATKEIQQIARAKEIQLAKAIKGAKHLKDNEPFDVIVGSTKNPNHLIEVKTIIRGKNSKITMHPDALQRKLAFAEKYSNARVSTVVFDSRAKTGGIFYKDGVGSFRINSMTEFKSLRELNTYFETGELSTTKVVPKKKSIPKKYQVFKKDIYNRKYQEHYKRFLAEMDTIKASPSSKTFDKHIKEKIFTREFGVTKYGDIPLGKTDKPGYRMGRALGDWVEDTQLDRATALKKVPILIEKEKRSAFIVTRYNEPELKKLVSKFGFDDNDFDSYIRLKALGQAYYEKKGIKEVKLFRGTEGRTGTKIADALDAKLEKALTGNKAKTFVKESFEFRENSIVGYSSDWYVAYDEFGAGSGGITITRTIPTKDILVPDEIWAKLRGVQSEKEFLVLNSPKTKVPVSNIGIASIEDRTLGEYVEKYAEKKVIKTNPSAIGTAEKTTKKLAKNMKTKMKNDYFKDFMDVNMELAKYDNVPYTDALEMVEGMSPQKLVLKLHSLTSPIDNPAKVAGTDLGGLFRSQTEVLKDYIANWGEENISIMSQSKIKETVSFFKTIEKSLVADSLEKEWITYVRGYVEEALM